MSEQFDPGELCSEASLNRTLVGDRAAFELLSADAVASLDGTHGAEEVGRRLAALLTALKTCDPRSGLGVAPSPWRQAYLAHWRTVSHVSLGGGTTARFGHALADSATRHLHDLGVAGLTVHTARHPAELALIGAARSITTASRAAVFDFGHTLVKRGIASYDEAGRLTAINLRTAARLDTRAMTRAEVVDAARSTVDSTLASSAEAVDAVVISVAAYLRDGQPGDLRSAYGALRSRHFSRNVVWVHDGTAAGRAVASHTPGAVIMLGTAIGVGFAADPSTVAPADTDFAIT